MKDMFEMIAMSKRMLPLLFCLAFAGGAMGQTQPLAGQMVDSNGKPLVIAPQHVIGPNGQIITQSAPVIIKPGDPAPTLPANFPQPPRGHHESAASVSDDGGITLNFVDADVRDVAKAVLGDFLGLNYAVGASVQGTVTIQTSRPVAKADVLPVLEQALQLNGLALVKNAGIYNVVPLADARRQNGAITTSNKRRERGEPGFGVQIVPLRYVGAAQMQKLLEPLVPSQAIVYADSTRNFLIIEGSEDERAAMVDEIGLFDVNWLKGMSFALLTPKYTDVTSLAKELGEILGGEHNSLSDVVRLVPILRLNAILAISPQPRYLSQLEQWMNRLDQPGQGSEKRIFFYPVQSGRAADLADVLNHSLNGGRGTQGAQSGASDSFSEPMQMGGSPSAPQGETQTSAPAPAAKPDNGGASDSTATGSDNATITVDKANNALVIYGTPQQYSIIEAALHKMDVAPIQVQLEVAIAEVTLNDGLQYGVQYFYQPDNKQQLVLSNGPSAAITSVFPGFSYMFTQGTNIRVILNALSNVTHVEVISSPEIMVLNNGTARLEVGQQVPISTGQAVSTLTSGAPIVNSIEYHATGVILKVTPGVNKSGMVTMDVSQEVSNVATDADQSTATLGSPTFDERKIQSTVAIHDNETIALGGLISDSKTQGSSGLPFLSEIPVLGGLFGTKNDTRVRTELMVLITPHVVDNLQAARAVTDELRQKFPTVQPLFEKNK
jgi:general secretion pathway protein D